MTQLKSFREKVGLTQVQLAEQLSISRTTVSMWESGESKPRADKLPTLAKIFGCTINDLFDDKERG